MFDRFQRFSYAMSEISRFWHKLAAQEMEPYGLKGQHCIYLMTLYRHPNGITATQLGKFCGKDKADVSRMMSLMEEKGLICREGHAYRALIRLTPQGITAAEQVQKRAASAMERAGNGVDEASQEQFYETMDRVLTNLQAICEEGLSQ